MTTILDLVDNLDDVCALPFFTLFLILAGGTLAGGHPTIHQWGKRLAAAGGLTYAVYFVTTFRPVTAEEFLGLAVRTLFAAAIALGLSWITLAVCNFVFRYTLAYPLSHARRACDARRRRQIEREQNAQRTLDANRRAYEESARQARDQERARVQEAAKQRRMDAQADLIRAFNLYEPRLGDRVTKEMVDQYRAEFMGDAAGPDDVERRARDLIAVFEQHAAQVEPETQPKTIERLMHWFQTQSEQLDTLPEGRLKNSLRAELNTRYAELLTQLLQDMNP